MNSKERFMAAAARPLKTIDVKVNGEAFVLRELSEGDAAEMEVKMQTKGGVDFTQHRRLLVSYCLIDSDGNRVIDNPDDLKSLPRSAIGQLYDQCLTLSAYDPKEIEALAKK